jgi:HD-like signal output (HDOD) protein
MSPQVTPEEKKHVVEAAVKEISHIATLPEVTVKIIELVEDPNSTAQDLHKIISNDPALCSRILKVVNSAFYGLPGQIGSINRAIVLLGLNAVKNIAIAASLSKLYRGGQLAPEFSAKDLWVHSISTAAAAKLVADAMKLGLPDEAFLGGLIHDIGVIVEMQHDRQKLIDVVGRLGVKGGAPSENMLEIEEQIFGATHQDFGRALCERWKFPKSFSYVTGSHHNPLELAAGNRTLACVIYVADRLAARVDEEGFRLDLQDLDLDPGVLEELKLSSEQVESILEQLPQHIEDVKHLMG